MQKWRSLISLSASSPGSRANQVLAVQLSARQDSLRLIGLIRRVTTKTGASRLEESQPPVGQMVSRNSLRKQSTTGANLSSASSAATRRSHEEATVDGSEQHKEETLPEQQLINRYYERLLDQIQQVGAHNFVKRHIGPTLEDQTDMLRELGYETLDELIEATIPQQIRLERELKLPERISEAELLEELRAIGSENESNKWRSFIGMGYYDCESPAVIMRNLFENPGWTTAYTAYQAEIAQGRLESLMNYQTMICDLTRMDVANASLLDEATAASEALQVCLRFNKAKEGARKLLVSSRCHPQTIAVVEARAEGLGVAVDQFDELDELQAARIHLAEYSGLLVQYPNTTGHLLDLDGLLERSKQAGCMVVVATDLMACTLFKPPGDFKHRPELVVGSSQRFGVPLNFGGPHAAFLACKQELVRAIPGRVVGLTRDSNGNQAYRFALQTREQHIRRDKATSNICTAQALLANMSAMYAIYHGPQGLTEIATSIHAKTSLLAHMISKRQQRSTDQSEDQTAQLGKVELLNENSYFDTLTLRVGNPLELKRRAQECRINLRFHTSEQSSVQAQSNLVSISLDETTKLADIFRLHSLFLAAVAPSSGSSTATGRHGKQSLPVIVDGSGADSWKAGSATPRDTTILANGAGKLGQLKRTTAFLTHPTFNSYRSEAQLVRYMKHLENKDISLTHSMIPLGSCTMKLNATSQMIASSWPEFARCHPFNPPEQNKGYLRLFSELDDYLCEITGYDKISFQPNSGAQGEYAGLRTIKSYLASLGQLQRDVCLIPISAHGTNPASAQMAGFRIQTIKVRQDGNIDLEDLCKNIEKHRDQLACLMVTYPSTFGVFEQGIRQICQLIHEAGGQVYLDGANMNAQVGLCRPADYGSDVSHLNLHKTFCIPHGGGGPGAGPIGVKSHLIPFLPSHPLQSRGASFGAVSASMWGSAAILPISWSYIRLMGKDLRHSSEVAILNANYMKKRLENRFKILFKGEKGNVAHEFIIDCRPFKKTANIEAVDIAKRLQDFSLHAPTVSWPVPNTLMIEPTESEDKEQLDRYCDALLIIREEIEAIEKGLMHKMDNPIKNSPHTQQVVCSSKWDRAYSREQAAFPAHFVKAGKKIWPTVGRVDDTYGDTNLFCSCPPFSEQQQQQQQQQR